MWPSRNNNGSSSSASKSSSSCSHPSSSGTPTKISMEEVWQDISLLPSLQDHTNTAAPNSTTASLIFQNFFARPFNKDSVSFPQSAEPSNNSGFGTTPLTPHHGTLLSLNSRSGFHSLENVNQRPSHQLLHGFPLNNSFPFDNNDSLCPAQVKPSICLKRHQENGDHSNDRRHKRMMKNRESSSRSRARKQAYTTGLEKEVARLKKENVKLRRQQQQLLAVSGLPKKHTLYRSSTAPF